MTSAWLIGIIRRRPFATVGAAVSIAVTVAFIAALGAFVTASNEGLTRRASARVAVDWQVQVTPQGSANDVAAVLARTPGVRAVLPVRFTQVAGLQSTSGSGTRNTGRAFIVALPLGYAEAAPGEIRYLLGSHSGILLQQQTAANLGAGTGSVVTITVGNGAHRTVRVAGVADLPQADSFFQVIGASAGAGAAAPPDNVLLVPPDQFAGLTANSPAVTQFHVQFVHASLPADPAAAANLVSQRANHFAAQVAGGALVGNNLQAALSAAREDALYAQLLLLLLGIPGVVLAAIVAGLVVALRGDRRRREVALLRMRGATPRQVIGLIAAETALTGGLGVLLGIPMALLATHLALPAGTRLTTGWTAIAAASGLAIAAATQLGPAIRASTRSGADEISDAAARALPVGQPLALRLGSDVLLLAAAGIVFYFTARGGYQVVVVPEGVPVASVDYAALLGPALAWPGMTLLIWRINLMILRRRRGVLLRDRPGRAPELTAAAVRRRHRVISRGAAGLAVAVGLAASTALFTATYDKQAALDVALTVGADVSLTEPPGSAVPPAAGQDLLSTPGARAVEPLQHRLAYVGADLQDLYGIRPASIRQVAPLLDSFVPGSSISSALQALSRTPDGALLSAETVRDYQLNRGDLVHLRLQAGRSGGYQPFVFHVIGVVKEFPTAPKDSFIVTNADYITKITGSNAVGTFLIRSANPAATAAALRDHLPAGAQIHDTHSDRSNVPSASGLASSDLSGLSRLELGFGLLLALACSGLALALGIAERRRGLVLLAALGATPRQRGRFLTAEARALIGGGLLGGAALGAVIAFLLVKVLNGIFDPPPTGLSVPVGYLAGLVASLLAVSALVLMVVGRLAARAGPRQLRDL